MSDIELLIKIPEEDYKRGIVMASAIRNGIPLPKGHGRLIDADAISLDDIGFFSISDYQKMVHKLTTSCQTIIEADKEKWMFKYNFAFKNNSVISFESEIDIDLHKIKMGEAIAFENLWINTNEVKTIAKIENGGIQNGR